MDLLKYTLPYMDLQVHIQVFYNNVLYQHLK